MSAYRILVVEDNPMNLQLVTDVLTASGLSTRAAGTAEEALSLARSEPIDLILMDISLPGLDGLEAIRCLSADPKTADIPVVAVTAHAMRGDRERMLAAGASGYIAKPIDTRSIAAQVLSFLPPSETAADGSSLPPEDGAR
jgi:CheY-like chemotaxis protein